MKLRSESHASTINKTDRHRTNQTDQELSIKAVLIHSDSGPNTFVGFLNITKRLFFTLGIDLDLCSAQNQMKWAWLKLKMMYFFWYLNRAAITCLSLAALLSL